MGQLLLIPYFKPVRHRAGHIGADRFGLMRQTAQNLRIHGVFNTGVVQICAVIWLVHNCGINAIAEGIHHGRGQVARPRPHGKPHVVTFAIKSL